MGRNRYNKWWACFVGVIASLGAVCSGGKHNYVKVPDEDHLGNSIQDSSPRVTAGQCETVKDSLMMFVSTLDGRVSVLDVKNEGQLMWSVQADARPLLSSSIGKLELNKDGVRTRLIPSLDGGLYQYDGDSIEAVPITAEKLLGSSFRLDDKTMMIGGKDTKSYGVDALSGQVRYVCGVEGCKFLGEGEVTDDEDIIVIKRSTQTVRAVDSKSGTERWNFSVGHHELEFVDASLPISDDEREDEDGVTITPCPIPDESVEEEEEKLNEYLDQALKIIVPEGMIVSLSPDHDNQVMWQHKFSSPVTNAWLLKKGVMKRLSLFDNQYVPALSSFQPDNSIEGLSKEPLLYVGMHQNQLYVQPSATLREDMMNAPGSNFSPQIAWRPYLSTAPSRTPIFSGNKPGTNVPLLKDNSVDNEEEKSLIVWHENYPFDNGYYLYPAIRQNLLPVHNLTPEADTIMYLPASLHYWWKEVIAISLITSVVLHMILTKIVKKEHKQISESNDKSDNNNITVLRSDSENSESSEFISRFDTEFDFVHCLGKGGFGVVFEATKKMDECNYAIKRICLSNSLQAKDRVMREVRALAKLDHPGIVRYFNAWMETPPFEWKDSLGLQIEDSECLTPTPCNSGNDLSSFQFKNQRQFLAKFGKGDCLSKSDEWNLKCGNSQTFEVHPGVDSSCTDESGSYSIGTIDTNKHCDNNEDSFQIEFAESRSGVMECNNDISSSNDTSVSKSESLHISHAVEESFSIVFEDSGCKDKSSNDSNQSNVVFRIESTETETTCTKSKKIEIVKKETKTNGNMYLYIQMQLCRRETLKDWLCANTLNRDRRTILDVFDQIVEAVDYVHSCGMMHRDLKPSNIFFSMDGAIKIGDFGLVTGTVEKQIDEYIEQIGMTDKHTAEVGTQLYMSPEQVARATYDHKVDIFSMGMILFELFYPFSTQMERIQTLVNVKKLVFPERFLKEMPTEKKFVEWLLASKPSDRPSTTQILESELLQEFAVRRTASRFRNRTISGGSSTSLSTP